jgi:hypothetical protein
MSRMSKMRHMQVARTDRRRFCRSMAGLIGGLWFGNLTLRGSKVPIEDQDFLIVNGWVLTRKDVAASDVTFDAV